MLIQNIIINLENYQQVNNFAIFNLESLILFLTSIELYFYESVNNFHVHFKSFVSQMEIYKSDTIFKKYLDDFVYFSWGLIRMFTFALKGKLYFPAVREIEIIGETPRTLFSRFSSDENTQGSFLNQVDTLRDEYWVHNWGLNENDAELIESCFDTTQTNINFLRRHIRELNLTSINFEIKPIQEEIPSNLVRVIDYDFCLDIAWKAATGVPF